MIRRRGMVWTWVAASLLLTASSSFGQTATVAGVVRDETGGALPGVSVELRGAAARQVVTVTDSQGAYRFDGVALGHYRLAFLLINLRTPIT